MGFNDLNSMELTKKFFQLEDDHFKTKSNSVNKFEYEVEKLLMYIRS